MDLREQRRERGSLESIARCLLSNAQPHGPDGAAVRGLWRTAEQHRQASIVATATPRIITSGWAAWCRTTPDRRRVIFLFLMPGDVLTPSICGSADAGEVIALTPVRSVDASDLCARDDQGAPITPVANAWIEQTDRAYRARLLDHLAWLNEGSALRNLARLLVELHERARAAGRCIDGRFDVPVGQRTLAQALGLSAVQVNKMMQRLRETGLIAAERGWIRVEQDKALRELAHGCAHATAGPAKAADCVPVAATPFAAA